MKRKRGKGKPPAKRVTGTPVAWWWHLLAIVGLFLANLLLYASSLHLGFFSLDDPDYVVNNPYITSLAWTNIVRICTAPYFANFSPLHLLSYSLDVAVAGGLSAYAFHLSSVLWGGLVASLVYVLAFVIRGSLPIAAGAALLFLAHPAHVEVIAWISSRKDLVATTFGLLAMICYLLYRRQGTGARAWYAASLFAFLLATAAKQSVVLLPAVMLAWDFLVEKRRHWAMVLDKIPFGLITILFALQTMGAQPDTRRSYDLAVLAANQLWNLWLLTGLGPYVIYRPTLDAADWNPVGHALVIGLVAAAWIGPLLLRHLLDPVRVMLWFWILIQLIPPMIFNFVTPVTDRYLFLPSVGFCLLLADLILQPATRPRTRPWGYAAALLAIAGLWGYQTAAYLAAWNDPRTVWFAAVNKSRAFQNNEYLGTAYHNAGDRLHHWISAGAALDPARELPLARALVRDPLRVAQLEVEWKEAPPNKPHSTAYRDQLYDLAWDQFELAVKRRGTINTPNLFMRRGMILVNRGRHSDALEQFHVALRFAQTHSYDKVRQENVTHAKRAIGVAHWKLRQYAEAQKWFLEAQQAQRASGQVWISTLNQEVEQISRLAKGQGASTAGFPTGAKE